MAAAVISRILARRLRQQLSPAIPQKCVPQSSLLSTSAPAMSDVPQPELGQFNYFWAFAALAFQEEKEQVNMVKAVALHTRSYHFWPWHLAADQKTRKGIEMLEYRKNRLKMEPLKGNEVLSASGSPDDSIEFRRVECKGVFDEKKSIYVGPRSRSISGVTENGYYLITPLVPVLGDSESVQSPILVNRGWVPRGWRDKALEASEDTPPLSNSPSTSTREETAKASWWHFWSNTNQQVLKEPLPSITPIKVVGVIRGSENPSVFVPENVPNASQWFYVDVPAFARECGLPEKTLYVEDINENINPSRPYPVPKDVNTLIRSSVMPQDHVNYTLTWYSLSAAVTFMAYKRLKLRKSRRR
ncbi:Surfeit locus protein 1 [Castilleja foliolosa]|uniref:SURF1-like protein n=1 Tax=Castilleja foliolosa TaxID=1961234 RepID=A0ABD3BVA1_9LAMI